MKKKIALFVNINQNYFLKAVRCFEIFEEQNPGVFEFFIITSDTEAKSLPNVNVIVLNPKDYIEGYSDTRYPPESFLYYAAPNILYEKGYKYSMHVDADVVCLKKLDFSWLSEDFIIAGAPRMRNDLSEQIDCWHFLNAVCDNDTIEFLESTFELQNKDNIIDIQDGVMVINNEKWVSEGLYEKAYNLFVTCKDAGYPMKDTDILAGLLMLDTPKSFWKHLTPSWNWYYERAEVESMGGDDINILHMAWVKPWAKKQTKNRNIQKGLSIWNKKDQKMRLHIIGVPRNPSTSKISIDAFAMVSYYLTTYLHRAGHEVHYYGYKESTVECTKKWECGDKEFHEKHYVTEYEKNYFEHNDKADKIYWEKACNFLEVNYNAGEIVISMWSPGVDYIVDYFSNNSKNIQPLVDGHIGSWWPSLKTPYHVWASHANQHFNYGKHNMSDFWHDATIYPMANELSNFEYNEDKSDYFLFMGRLSPDKGVGIFIDLANHFKDKKFILAGQGINTDEIPSNVKEVGYLNVIQRKEYLSNAKAVISPSHYAEPFGLTAAEAGLSGTPIICTDHGGYTESVIEGVTGFRCSYFNDFVNAVNNIDKIKPKDCRNFAEKFSAESLIKDWEKYLHRINRDGWYTLD